MEAGLDERRRATRVSEGGPSLHGQWALIVWTYHRVLVQILLHFLCLSLTPKLAPMPLASPLPKKRKQKDHVSAPHLPESSSSPYKRGRRRKRRSSPPPFSVEDNLDMLTDQVSMWQAVDDDVDKFLKRPNDNDRDWMRVFCEDVVGSM